MGNDYEWFVNLMLAPYTAKPPGIAEILASCGCLLSVVLTLLLLGAAVGVVVTCFVMRNQF